jgi:hypothetical protein
MLKQTIKAIVNSSPFVKATALATDDFIYGLRLQLVRLIQILVQPIRLFLKKSQSSYVEEVFTDYKKYGSLDKFSG